MQVLDEAYSNFVNSINSDQTRQVYEYTLSQFLKHYQMDLDTFLKLSQQDISNYIINRQKQLDRIEEEKDPDIKAELRKGNLVQELN